LSICEWGTSGRDIVGKNPNEKSLRHEQRDTGKGKSQEITCWGVEGGGKGEKKDLRIEREPEGLQVQMIHGLQPVGAPKPEARELPSNSVIERKHKEKAEKP